MKDFMVELIQLVHESILIIKLVSEFNFWSDSVLNCIVEVQNEV